MRRMLTLLACLMLVCGRAAAQEAVVLLDRVLLRAGPGGAVVTHLNAGEKVTVMDETYLQQDDPSGGLWYGVQAGPHAGYVDAAYVRPARWGNGAEAVTDGLLAFQAEVYRFQVEYGFLAVPEGMDCHAFTWEPEADTEEARMAMEGILRCHGLKDATLESHYGTRELWKIFGDNGSNNSVWVHDSDWHWPLPATAEEQQMLERHRTQVLADFLP